MPRWQSATQEALRCLYCYNAPCNAGCPAEIDVAGFVRSVATGDEQGACEIIHRANPLAFTCGALCPVDHLCASRCPAGEVSVPIAIGEIQCYAALMGRRPRQSFGVRFPQLRVAIVGAGPAGVTAAVHLSQMGYPVEIFESRDRPGGQVLWGVPPFRADKNTILREFEQLLGPGIVVHYGAFIQNPLALLDTHKAVFVAGGLREPRLSHLDGEELPGVVQALWLLEETNRAALERRDTRFRPEGDIVVIGGGNTAVDVAVTLKRMNARKVTVVYRRGEKEMPAWPGALSCARAEGIGIEFFMEPVRLEGDTHLRAVRFRPTRLGPVGRDGRPSVEPQGGKEIVLAVSMAVLALGQEAGEEITRHLPSAQGRVLVDHNTGATPLRGVFAGGDLANGGATVVQAVRDAKRSAQSIHRFLQGDALI